VSDQTPQYASLAELRAGAMQCKACCLWEKATQTVFGQGPANAELMLVEEQPGGQEDLVGKSFVGPAGDIFVSALKEAGIDRESVYVTNAVKHFKFQRRGKRRVHQTPTADEVEACRWWLQEERRLINPKVIVALGLTAAQSVLNRSVSLVNERGRPVSGENGETILPTVGPLELLHMTDRAERQAQFETFVADLSHAGRLIG